MLDVFNSHQYAALNGTNVYYSLYCPSGYLHIALSFEAQMSAFVTTIDKPEFKKVPYNPAQATVHFHQLINEVLKVSHLPLDI